MKVSSLAFLLAFFILIQVTGGRKYHWRPYPSPPPLPPPQPSCPTDGLVSAQQQLITASVGGPAPSNAALLTIINNYLTCLSGNNPGRTVAPPLGPALDSAALQQIVTLLPQLMALLAAQKPTTATTTVAPPPTREAQVGGGS